MGFNSGNAGSAFSTQTAAASGSFGSGNFGSAFGQQQPARGGARGKPQQHQGIGMSQRGRGGMGPAINNNHMMHQNSSDRGNRGGRGGNDRGQSRGGFSRGGNRGGGNQPQYQHHMQNSHQGNFPQQQQQQPQFGANQMMTGGQQQQQQHQKQHQGPKAFQQQNKQRSVPASIRGPGPFQRQQMMFQSAQSDDQMMDVDDQSQNKKKNQKQSQSLNSHQTQQNFTAQNQGKQTQIIKNKPLTQTPSPIQGFNQTQKPYVNQSSMSQPQNQSLQRNTSFSSQLSRNSSNQSFQSLNNSAGAKQQQSGKPSPQYQNQNKGQKPKDFKAVIDNKKPAQQPKTQIPQVNHGQPFQKQSQQPKAPAPKQTPPPPSQQPIEDEEEEYQEDDYYDEEDNQGEYGEEDLYGEEDPESEEVEVSASPIQFTKEEISQIYLIKKQIPEAAKVCTHFITGQCKYGDACREQHNQKVKTQMIQLIKIYRANQKEGKQGTQADDKGEVIKPKPKGPDLRDTVLSQPSVSKQPQEQKEPLTGAPKPLARIPSKDKEEEKAKSMGKKTLMAKNQDRVQPQQMIVEQKNEDQQLVIPNQLSRRFQQPSLSSSLSLQRSESITQTTLTCQTIKDRMNKYIADFNKIRSQPDDYIIQDKAECLGMCPDEEIYTRSEVEFSSVSKFERDAQGQNFKQLAIKAYQRSAADKKMNDKDKIRPPAILFKTLEYLRDCISDLDRLADMKIPYSSIQKPSFTDVQSFFRDRAKSISQDFVIIDEPENKYVIQCLEQIIRYYIAVVHDMYLEGQELPQQVKLINSNLSNLMACYQAVKNSFPDENDPYRVFCLRNEAEFNCYQIINLANNKLEALQGISHLDIKYFSKDPKGLEYLKQAIAISLNIADGNNPSRFMMMLKRQKHYLFACLMLQFLNSMRAELLDNINKSIPKQCTMDIEFISKSLLFDDQQDAISFVEACGFQTINDAKVSKENRVSIQDEQQKQMFIKWIQVSSLSFMDNLLGTQSRGQIMQTSLLNSQNAVQKIPSISNSTKQNIAAKPEILSNSNIQQPVQKPKPLVQTEIKPLAIIQEEEEEKSDKIQQELKKKEAEEKLRKEEIEKKKKADEAAVAAAALKKAQDEAAEAERKRLKKIEDDKQERAMNKFKTFAKYIVSQHNQQVKATLLQFVTEKRPLIGIKRQRSITSFTQEMQEVNEEEYLDLVLQKLPSLTQQKRISEIFHDAQFKTRMSQISNKTQELSVEEIAKKILQEQGQEGVFRIKLFYHKVNNDPTSSACENLKAVQDLMSKKENIKTEKVNYNFKSLEFPESDQDNQRAQTLMSNFLGSNLIVIFSSIKTLNGDISKIKQALKLCPQFASFSMLWLVNRDLDKNSGSKEAEQLDESKLISDEIQIFKRSEVLSSLNVCTLYSSQIKIKKPMNKRMNLSRESSSTSSLHPTESKQITKNIALSFMHEQLESAIKASKIYQTSKKSIVMLNLKEVINKAIGEHLINIMGNQKSQLLKHIKTFSSLKNVKNTGIFQSDDHHEIDILNFLVELTKKLLSPICIKIKSSIKQVCQQFKSSDLNIKTSRDLLEQYERFGKVMAMKPFSYLDSQVFGERMGHVQDQIRKQFTEFYDKHAIFTHVLKALNNMAVYDNTITQDRIQIYHGVSIYQILFAPYFESIPEHSFIFEDPKSLSPIPALIDLDLSSLLSPPAKKKTPSKSHLQAAKHPQLLIQQSQPEPVKKSQILKKRSAADVLIEELNEQMDPLRFSNKQKEVEAKRSLDIQRAVTANDSFLREIIAAQEEEEIMQKIKEDANKRVKIVDFKEHERELEELQKLLGDKGSKKKRGV